MQHNLHHMSHILHHFFRNSDSAILVLFPSAPFKNNNQNSEGEKKKKLGKLKTGCKYPVFSGFVGDIIFYFH